MKRLALALTLFVLFAAGCQGTSPANFWRPGVAGPQLHAEMQGRQQVSQQFDPYPSPELGPDTSGARPPDFDRPRSETAKTQRDGRWLRAPSWNPFSWFGG